MNKFKARDYAIFFSGLLSTAIVFSLFIRWPEFVACLSESFYGCYPPVGVDVFLVIYDNKLRSDFFSGFLSVGAFLLSLKTFIVMTMKTGVYDTEKYKKTWERNRLLDDSVGPVYQGLKELNDCMFNSIFFSLVAAAAQVTIGIVSGALFVFMSLLPCVISIFYLAYCLFLVKRNLDLIIES